VFRIARACLDEELIPPTLKGLESVGDGDIVDQDATVCASIECYPEALKPLLTSCVPDLHKEHICDMQRTHAMPAYVVCLSVRCKC